jgi:hypothetical protein
MKPDSLISTGFAGNAADFYSYDPPFDNTLEKRWSAEQRRIVAKRRDRLDPGPVVLDWEQQAERVRRRVEEWNRFHDLLGGEAAETEFAEAPREEPVQDLSPVLPATEVGDLFGGQLELWSQTEFTPSRALLKFWQDGLDFHMPERQKGLLKALTRLVENTTMRNEFSDQFLGALIEELRFERSESAKTFPLFPNGSEFFAPLELKFSNLFPIRPRDLSGFMEQLSKELREYFEAGNVIGGSWGKIQLIGDGVLVSLTPREKVVFEPATKKTMHIDL